MENIRVAIVEDEHQFLALWSEILQNTPGIAFAGAYNNVADAVAHLPKVMPDIVLMDIQISPDETGIQCIYLVKDKCPHTQFMMFTVFEDDDHIFESLKVGATGYILKKTSSEKVLEAIHELYQGGSPMSPGIARKVLTHFHQHPPQKEEYKLTPREKEILEQLAKGYYYKEIAENLKISIGNLKQRVHDIYTKLCVNNRTEAINTYFGKK